MNVGNHTIRMEPQDWGFVVTLGGQPWLELCVQGGATENPVIVTQALPGTQQQDHNHACSVEEAAHLLRTLGLDAGPLLRKAGESGWPPDAEMGTAAQAGDLAAAGYYSRDETGLVALLLGCAEAPHDRKVILAADEARLRKLGEAWAAADMGTPAFALVDVEVLPGEPLGIVTPPPPPGAQELVRTMVVAYIVEGLDTYYPPGVYAFWHKPGIDVQQAAHSAAEAFAATANGEEYAADELGGDRFNWGDAVTAIPSEIWEQFGIAQVDVLDLGPDVVVVDHDEALVENRHYLGNSLRPQSSHPHQRQHEKG